MTKTSNVNYVKMETLFLALGYSERTYKGQKTTQLQKHLEFTKEDAQKTEVLKVSDTIQLLESIGNSKSKYKTVANELAKELKEGTNEDLLTEDKDFKPEVKKATKSKVFKYLKADLEQFIRDNGLWEDFQESKGYKAD